MKNFDAFKEKFSDGALVQDKRFGLHLVKMDAQIVGGEIRFELVPITGLTSPLQGSKGSAYDWFYHLQDFKVWTLREWATLGVMIESVDANRMNEIMETCTKQYRKTHGHDYKTEEEDCEFCKPKSLEWMVKYKKDNDFKIIYLCAETLIGALYLACDNGIDSENIIGIYVNNL